MPSRYRSSLAALALSVVTFPAGAQVLAGRAVLPADSFTDGPTSGQFITATNGRTPPFVSKQPIQGISSVLRTPGGDFLVMQDNGFGAQSNSYDVVLRVFRIHPDFKTKTGGTGQIAAEPYFSLSDPDHKVNFTIIADLDKYPGSSIPVDPVIRAQRLLTGGDFDIESFRQAHDGTYWFGEEFGPFLLHTDSTGRLLEAPIPLPGVKSPQNPFLGAGAWNLPRSKGYEGMAISPDSKTLYPMLEGALTTDDQRRLRIYEFDIASRAYTGRIRSYRLDSAAYAIGDLTAVSKNQFLVIERDNEEGAKAQFKKIFFVDFNKVDGSGYLEKTLVVDLLNIRDRHNIGGFGPIFRFPFTTIESVIPLSSTVIGVLDDNNYPFSSGRMPGQPDPNEFILIKLDRPLAITE